MSQLTRRAPTYAARPERGFTLIELMVAIGLGLLLSVGLVTLFGATSKTSRIQNAMALMQENGRFAVQRLSYDMRLASRQIVNATGFSSTSNLGSNGAVGWANAPQVYLASLQFPDMATAISAPPGFNAAAAYFPLSPRYFYQGYECASGSCLPNEPASSGVKLAIPVSGTTVGKRVPKTDVLVMRYLSGEGLSVLNNDYTISCPGAVALGSLTLNGANATSTTNFVNGDLVMLTTSSYAGVFQVSRAGAVLTPINVPNGGFVPCIGTQANSLEVSLYNFSRNFVTVAYWLQLTADPNDATHLIPSLYRAQGDNTGAVVTPQELVQGVDRLDFLYGVQETGGGVSYADAGQVSQQPNTLTCSPAPQQFVDGGLPNYLEPGCLWRSVKTIEAHLLVDSVTNMYDLTNADLAYRYNSGYSSTMVYDGVATPPTTMPSGLPFGKVLRREFVALVAQRNYNP